MANAVHVLDLAIIIPVLVLGAWWLCNGETWGRVLTPALLADEGARIVGVAPFLFDAMNTWT